MRTQRLNHRSRRAQWMALAISILFVFCLTRVHTPSFAQTGAQGVLRGAVTDRAGAAIAGARVVARSSFLATQRATVTDATGQFTFTDLAPADDYEVTMQAPDFRQWNRAGIVVANGQRMTVDASLETGLLSEAVTVTAARGERDTLDTPEPISVVSQQRLQERNLANVVDSLRELPGVSVQSAGPMGVKPIIRGLDGARTLLLVDGVRFNNSRQRVDHTGGGEAVEPGLIDISEVESVEVVRGGGSVLYGSDAVGGIFNVITKEAPRPFDGGWRFGGELGGRAMSNGPGQRGDGTFTMSTRAFNLRATQSLEKYSPYSAGSPVPPAFINYFGTGGVGARYITADFLRNREVLGTQLTGRGMALNGRVFINDQHSLRGDYIHRRGLHYGSPNSLTRFPFTELDRGSVGYLGSSLTSWLSQVSATVYTQRLSRNILQITDTSLPFIAPGTNPLVSYQETIINPNTTGFDAQAVITLPLKNVLTVGSSFFQDRSRDNQVLIQGARNLSLSADAARSLIAANLTENGFNEAFRRANNKPIVPNGLYRNLGLFAQDEFQLLPRLRLVAGLRLDTFRIESQVTDGFTVLGGFFTVPELSLPSNQSFKVNDHAFTGSFGAVFRVREGLNINARVGRSYHTPGIYERFNASPNHAVTSTTNTVTAPNPELQPETGWNVDVGVRLQTKRIAAELTYFNNTYSNLIASAPIFINNDPAQGPRTITEPPAITPLFVRQRTNLARARVQGLEAQLEIPIEFNEYRVTFHGNASHQRGDDLVADVPLDPVFYPAIPLRSVIGLRFDQPRRSRWFAEYLVRIATKADRFPPNTATLNTFRRYNFGGFPPGYVVHDVRGGYTVRTEHVSYHFTLGVENIGNRFYTEVFSISNIPEKGRTLIGGLRLRFY